MIAVSFDIEALERSLDAVIKEAERKMVGMVQSFTYNFAVKALDTTPFGNSKTYFHYYNEEARLMVLPEAKEGRAKGGWLITLHSPHSQVFPDLAENREAQNIKDKFKPSLSSYKLGDTLFISNNVPYMMQENWTRSPFGALEDGYSAQAPRGIRKPTIETVMSTYQLQLADYYHKS